MKKKYSRWKIIPRSKDKTHPSNSLWYHFTRGLCEISSGLVIIFTAGYIYPGFGLSHTYKHIHAWLSKKKKINHEMQQKK